MRISIRDQIDDEKYMFTLDLNIRLLLLYKTECLLKIDIKILHEYYYKNWNERITV